MPQNPLGTAYGKSTLTGALAPFSLDSVGSVLVNAQSEGATTVAGSVSLAGGTATVFGVENGNRSALNQTVSAAIATVAGAVGVVVTNAPGTGAAGGLYDATVVSAAGAANLIASLPTTGSATSPVRLNFPFLAGLVFVPATGQVVSISYSLGSGE